MMNDNIRLAREIIAIAQELVEDNENEGQEIWKLMRVLNNGGREVTHRKFTFDSGTTDEQKIEAMEQQIKKTNWKFPPDCHTYTEKNQFVVKRDDGRVEWRMFKTSDGKWAAGPSTPWYLKKVKNNGDESFIDTVIFKDNSTTKDKIDQIMSMMDNLHVRFNRRNIVIGQDEIIIYVGGKVGYILRRKK